MALDKTDAPTTKESIVLPEVPKEIEVPVNGVNGSDHSTADEVPEPKKVYEGAELPPLRMAPAAPLAPEARAVQTIPDVNPDGHKTRKWLKRQKEVAGKFE